MTQTFLDEKHPNLADFTRYWKELPLKKTEFNILLHTLQYLPYILDDLKISFPLVGIHLEVLGSLFLTEWKNMGPPFEITKTKKLTVLSISVKNMQQFQALYSLTEDLKQYPDILLAAEQIVSLPSNRDPIIQYETYTELRRMADKQESGLWFYHWNDGLRAIHKENNIPYKSIYFPMLSHWKELQGKDIFKGLKYLTKAIRNSSAKSYQDAYENLYGGLNRTFEIFNNHRVTQGMGTILSHNRNFGLLTWDEAKVSDIGKELYKIKEHATKIDAFKIKKQDKETFLLIAESTYEKRTIQTSFTLPYVLYCFVLVCPLKDEVQFLKGIEKILKTATVDEIIPLPSELKQLTEHLQVGPKDAEDRILCINLPPKKEMKSSSLPWGAVVAGRIKSETDYYSLLLPQYF